ncbi:ATP synthase subunit I [Hoeflea sp. AS16]|uniref:N-ATPase subunit AtpR n=1 Tax=Hoeflea sp. AS16 TaxID=3135779 RepID=UPI003170311D
MIDIDWTAAMLGFGIGTVMGVVFFVGLAVGIRRALRTKTPIGILTLSAAVRLAAFLGVGWVVVSQGGPWAGLGYGIAFLVVRLVATTLARSEAVTGDAS